MSERGYGLGDLIEPEHLKFTITCFKQTSDGSPSQRSAAAFERTLRECIIEMADALRGSV